MIKSRNRSCSVVMDQTCFSKLIEYANIKGKTEDVRYVPSVPSSDDVEVNRDWCPKWYRC